MVHTATDKVSDLKVPRYRQRTTCNHVPVKASNQTDHNLTTDPSKHTIDPHNNNL